MNVLECKVFGSKYFSIISVLFNFILFFSSQIGLLPYSFALKLSFSIFIGINTIIFAKYQMKTFSLFLPANTTFFSALLLVPIEFVSYLAKSVSLGVRLFINLMAEYSLLIGTRFLSTDRSTVDFEERRSSIVTKLCDMFLKYQYNICVEPRLSSSHMIPISLLTSLSRSPRYVVIYCISIFYILITLSLAEWFPYTFGIKYLSFLQRNSSPKVFEIYCIVPFGIIESIIKNSEALKIARELGLKKIVGGASVGLGTQHVVHHMMPKQLYKYKMDSYMNGGTHSSNKPFSWEDNDNGPSVLDKILH